MTVLKILGTETPIDTDPQSMGSKTVRVFNSSTGQRTLTVEDIVVNLTVTVNATANGTTLLPVVSGNTASIRPGYTLVQSTNNAVVNTDVSSEVSAVNSTAVVANVDVIGVSGTADISVSKGAYTVTLNSNSEMIIYTGAQATLVSNNASDVLGTPVSVSG